MGIFDSGAAKTKPLDWQREPIREAFARNKMAVDRMSKAGPWAGANNTGMNQTQQDALRGTVDFNNGILGSSVPQLQNWGTQVATSGGQANATGQGQIAAGQGVSNAGIDMMGYGADYGSNAKGLFQRYGDSDVTGNVLGNAQRYMNDPTLQASIDAVGADAAHAFGRADLDRAGGDAMMGTSTNSRSGIEAANLKSDHERNFMATAAGMRSDARNQALTAGRSDFFDGANTAMNANQAVLGAGQYGADLYGLGQRGISGGVDSMSAGASMYGQGGNMVAQGAAMGQGALAGNLQAGGVQQSQDEVQRLADEERYYRDNGGFRQDMAQRLYGMAGDQNWGSMTEGGDGGLGSRLLGAGLTIGGTMLGGPIGGQIGGQIGSMFGGGGAPMTPMTPPTGFSRGANGMLGQI